MITFNTKHQDQFKISDSKYQIHGGLIEHATRQTSCYERFEASLLQRDTSSFLGIAPCQTCIPLRNLHFDREIQFSLPYKNKC